MRRFAEPVVVCTLLAGLLPGLPFVAGRVHRHCVTSVRRTASQPGQVQRPVPVRKTSAHHSGAVTASGHPTSGSSIRPTGFTADYTSHLDGGLQHWTRFPLHVAFLHDRHYTPALQQEVVAGFSEWTVVTRGHISFDLTDNPANADVIVRFDPQRQSSLTDTEFDTRTNVLSHADVRIGLMTAGDESEQVTLDDVRCLAAHEFGHALGINGHSDGPQDLMYPSLTSNRAVTLRDLNTLRDAYSW